MPKIRKKWYFTVKNLIADVMNGDISEKTESGKIIIGSVNTVVRKTAERPDGSVRLLVVGETIKRRNRYVAGVAIKFFVSERNVNRYTSEFVYAVAEELGYSGVKQRTTNIK